MRNICTSCIGASILAVSERPCPGCEGVHQVLLRLVEGIRDANERDQAVMAIVVPPNKTPHVEGCEYGSGDVVQDARHV